MGFTTPGESPGRAKEYSLHTELSINNSSWESAQTPGYCSGGTVLTIGINEA
jgi:hypothetical protein